MEKIIKEGKNLETILEEISNEYNVDLDKFSYHSYDKKTGLFNKNNIVVVEALLIDDLVQYIKEYLLEIINNMGIEVSFETKIREKVIIIQMHSSNNPVLIGKFGNTIKALETIVKQHIQTKYNIYFYLHLDVENYKEKQEKRLIHLARSLAKEVTLTKVSVQLDNMNAYDRRIVHNSLADFKDIKAESEGEEPNRHIIIKPL